MAEVVAKALDVAVVTVLSVVAVVAKALDVAAVTLLSVVAVVAESLVVAVAVVAVLSVFFCCGG